MDRLGEHAREARAGLDEIHVRRQDDSRLVDSLTARRSVIGGDEQHVDVVLASSGVRRFRKSHHVVLEVVLYPTLKNGRRTRVAPLIPTVMHRSPSTSHPMHCRKSAGG